MSLKRFYRGVVRVLTTALFVIWFASFLAKPIDGRDAVVTLLAITLASVTLSRWATTWMLGDEVSS